MKRLCVICDLGHASPRVPGLVTELVKIGWEVDVITPKLTNKQRSLFLDNHFQGFRLIEIKNFRCAYKIEYGQRYLISILYRVRRKIKKIIDLKLNRWDPEYINNKINFNGIEDHVGWVNKTLKTYRYLNRKSEYDIVLTTSSPFTAHIIGNRIASEIGTIWVADYRDLWNNNHALKETSSIPTRIDFEKKILQKATKIITVSKFFSEQITDLLNRPVSVVYNGFYKVESEAPQKFSENNNFLIAYTGSIFPKNMRYTEWLEACVDSILSGSSTSFVFAGRGVKEIEDYLNQNNISNNEKFVNLGFLSHEETLKLQIKSDALLLFGWDDPLMGGSLQTKFYEYMAAGKPVVLFGGNRNDECFEILNRIGGYISILSKDEAVEFLNNPRCYLRNISSSDEKTLEFSYSAQAIKLDVELSASIGVSQ